MNKFIFLACTGLFFSLILSSCGSSAKTARCNAYSDNFNHSTEVNSDLAENL